MGSDMDKLRNLRKEISSKESTIEKISEERKELLSQAKHIDQVTLVLNLFQNQTMEGTHPLLCVNN